MKFFVENINLVLFLPLFMCLVLAGNALISNKLDKSTLFLISLISSFICLFFSVFVFFNSMLTKSIVSVDFAWLNLDFWSFSLGILLDKVSVSFLLLVAFVNCALQIFAYLNVCDFFRFSKLIFLINFFAFSLNGLFLSSNLFQTYLFCEILGVVSYLSINFDFSHREQSKAGVKSFIYNRIGDLMLLFCVITMLYYAVIYNQMNNTRALAYTSIDSIVTLMNSMLSAPLFVLFCSMLLFVIIMKFMQAFVYIVFDKVNATSLSKIVFVQNICILLVGIFLSLRLETFFSALDKNWVWTIPVIFSVFILFGLLNKLFNPFCNVISFVEKYIVETVMNVSELAIRLASYLCVRFQAGNFQSYLLYSLIGLVLIFTFVLVFYSMFIKV